MMFQLIASRIPELFPTVQTITWNYCEAGHGKGAPDGIGGVLKRVADRVVSEGHDIPDFNTFFNTLTKKTNMVNLMKIYQENIDEESLWVQGLKNKSLFAVKVCLKVHQVCWDKHSEDIMFRTLSCFSCDPGQKCNHYHLCSKPNISKTNEEADICMSEIVTTCEEDDNLHIEDDAMNNQGNIIFCLLLILKMKKIISY